MTRKNGHDTEKYKYKRTGTIYNVRPVSGYYEQGCDPYFVLTLAVVMKAVDDIRLSNRYALHAMLFFRNEGKDLLSMLGIGSDEMRKLLSNVGFECRFDDLISSQQAIGKQIKVRSL